MRLTLGLSALLVALAIALPTSASAIPSPQLRKVCSGYAEEHFHDVTAHLPDGTKCIGAGEYCSHGPGFARAYREYGFVCKADGRLADDWPGQPTGPVSVSRWRVSLKLRRSQRPSPWTTRREIEPLSTWMKANGRLAVAIAQS